MENLDLFGGSGTPPEPKKASEPGHKYSAVELKAIRWYCENNNLAPGLSSYPKMIFTDKRTGEEITEVLSDLVSQYKDWNKENLKERARQRRVEKQMAENRVSRRVA